MIMWTGYWNKRARSNGLMFCHILQVNVSLLWTPGSGRLLWNQPETTKPGHGAFLPGRSSFIQQGIEVSGEDQ